MYPTKDSQMCDLQHVYILQYKSNRLLSDLFQQINYDFDKVELHYDWVAN